ncbi:MAG TPA: VWA domain-containing protein [Streptosporangiaceae bacterium]|nr:VWA domain-containing protein [Streptosporangiaceae bacterium]
MTEAGGPRGVVPPGQHHGLPSFLWEITHQLRRRGFPIGIDDYDALRAALAAGFGLSSDAALRELCVTLWAKSAEEVEIVRAAFSRVEIDGWDAAPAARFGDGDAAGAGLDSAASPSPTARPSSATGPSSLEATLAPELATTPPATGVLDRSLVLVPQFPLTEREVAQAWRRLRRPLRTGPAVEIDVTATIERRSRSGVVTPPVLTPRRRNTAKLLLMIDRYGSMTPYHGYVGHVVRAIRNAGRLDDVREVYFHDLPGGGSDRSVLDQVTDPFRPDLDSVLGLIRPLDAGRVYSDAELTEPLQLQSVLAEAGPGTAAVVISDAGAARQRLDTDRLLDTIALLKALCGGLSAVTWLNPARPGYWPQSTAGQVGRHIPMFPLTREGLGGAVDVLRGRPVDVERPL